jgi:hypothetical protein
LREIHHGGFDAKAQRRSAKVQRKKTTPVPSLKEGGELEGYGCVNRIIERYKEKLPGTDLMVCIAFLSVQPKCTVPLLSSRRGQGWSFSFAPFALLLCAFA